MALSRQELERTSRRAPDAGNLPQPEDLEWFQLFGFDGLNNKSPPSHIEDQQLVVCDNLHPVAPGSCRALGDLGPAVIDVSPRAIVDQPFYYNLGSTQYAAVLLDDGSIHQFLAVSPFTPTTIIPAGGIPSPLLGADFSQWGSQFLLIVSPSGNGYWIWDGSNLFTSGTIGPLPTIESGGARYTSTPTITAHGGSGAGATFSSTVEGGAVATINVTSPGSGWNANDAPITALLFTGGGSGTSALGTCGIANGVLTQAIVDNGGSGYTSVPAVTITDSGATGAGAVISVNGISGGIITSLKVINGGHDYGNAGTVTIGFAGGGGSNATAHVIISNGVINSVVMTNAGSGYLDTPEVVFISPTGSGAAATAVMENGTITNLVFSSGGSGYSSYAFAVFKSADGPAYATIQNMPFGITGAVSVTTFLSRVWISRAPLSPLISPSLMFSNIEDPADFGPPGGATPFTQEYLRRQVIHLIPSGSFLYLIGDSSVSYITGVSTSGTPAITTFSVVNIDPEIGSPWANSVKTFGQSVMFANNLGIYQVLGGNIRKVSTPIDDLYSSDVLNIQINPSSAVDDLNGTHVYGLATTVVDPLTQALKRTVILWDSKRWFTYTPSTDLQWISTNEFNSVISMWGSDGSKIYELFSTFNNLQKTLVTKRWTKPSIGSDKKALVLFMLVQPLQAATFHVSVVTEKNTTIVGPGALAAPASNDAVFLRSKADGFGKTIGLQVKSTSPQFTINELILGAQVYDIEVP